MRVLKKMTKKDRLCTPNNQAGTCMTNGNFYQGNLTFSMVFPFFMVFPFYMVFPFCLYCGFEILFFSLHSMQKCKLRCKWVDEYTLNKFKLE